MHGATKLVPAEVFQEEREYPRPLPVCGQVKRPAICRTVRKDNTIVYDSDRYSVPLGTHTTHPEARIETLDGTLYIQTLFGDPICEHRISSGRGLRIQSQSHRRDRTSKPDKLLEEVDAELDGRATEFLTAVRVDRSRYARDQFRLIHSLLDQYGVEAALQAIGFCQRSRLYSANTMRDYLEHQAALSGGTQPVLPVPAIPVDDPKYHVTTQKRPLDVYYTYACENCEKMIYQHRS